MTQDILVLYYSELGGTHALAEALAQGIESVPGVCARIRTVPPVFVLTETPSAPTSIGPRYATQADLKECIGLAMGSPTRLGNMAAPLKHFWDNSGGAWTSGALVNKPACVFTSAASMHGGHESTLLSMMIPLLHHGMLLLGCPYSEVTLDKTTTGGTPYGPSHYAGLQSKLPLSADETTIAFVVGKRLAKTALKLLEVI